MTAIRNWFLARSLREQRLILLMAAIALPLLLWLAIVMPISSAYDSALDAHLEAVDRNGRIRALAGRSDNAVVAGEAVSGDLALIVTDAASQAGLTLDITDSSGPDAVTIAISQASPTAVTQWLSGFEQRGIGVDDLRITPSEPGHVSVSARLTRADQ